MIENKKILIFGGSGSLGYQLIKRYIDKNIIYNYSRDENKHWHMRNDFQNHNNLNYVIGDIINYSKVETTIKRIDPHIIIIAAAMKHVDYCELNVDACINTNLLGIKNILEVIEKNDALLTTENIIFVSTDKACSPINTYGMCKAISEQFMIEKAYYLKSKSFTIVRYGNVLNSRGSIVPLLHMIGKDPQKSYFSLTHKDMTRFVMTLDQSVDLIEYAILHGNSGDIIVPTLVSMKLIDLFEIFSELYNKPVKLTSVRPGEKMMESLINETQSGRLVQGDNYYHIKNIFDYKETINVDNLKDYNSKINPLTKDELNDYLLKQKLI